MPLINIICNIRVKLGKINGKIRSRKQLSATTHNYNEKIVPLFLTLKLCQGI